MASLLWFSSLSPDKYQGWLYFEAVELALTRGLSDTAHWHISDKNQDLYPTLEEAWLQSEDIAFLVRVFFFGSLHVAMTYLQSVSLELRSVQCNGAISWTFGVPLSTMWSKPPKSRSSSLNQSPALLDVRESNVSIARWPVYKKKKKKIQRPTSTLFVFCNFQR